MHVPVTSQSISNWSAPLHTHGRLAYLLDSAAAPLATDGFLNMSKHCLLLTDRLLCWRLHVHAWDFYQRWLKLKSTDHGNRCFWLEREPSQTDRQGARTRRSLAGWCDVCNELYRLMRIITVMTAVKHAQCQLVALAAVSQSVSVYIMCSVCVWALISITKNLPGIVSAFSQRRSSKMYTATLHHYYWCTFKLVRVYWRVLHRDWWVSDMYAVHCDPLNVPRWVHCCVGH